MIFFTGSEENLRGVPGQRVVRRLADAGLKDVQDNPANPANPAHPDSTPVNN